MAPGELLKEAGYDVSYACDGEEMVEMVKAKLTDISESPFDMIITDVSMGKMNGTDAAHIIRGLEKQYGAKGQIPIVAVTGFASEHEKTQIKSYGINDVIDKPVDPRALSTVLSKFLNPASGSA